MCLAARGSFKNVLVWLQSEGHVSISRPCDWVACAGHIYAQKYLNCEGVAFDKIDLQECS